MKKILLSVAVLISLNASAQTNIYKVKPYRPKDSVNQVLTRYVNTYGDSATYYVEEQWTDNGVITVRSQKNVTVPVEAVLIMVQYPDSIPLVQQIFNPWNIEVISKQD